MSAQGAGGARKLFDIELPAPIATIVRKIEGLQKKPVLEAKLEKPDGSVLQGYFDDTGGPHIAVPKGAHPTLEDLTVEVVRLDFRKGRFEKNMPYSEMRHEANRRLCRRLYRIVEQEMVLAEAESLGVGARRVFLNRLESLFREPLVHGKYRTGEAEPGRLREGALDALELAISENGPEAARRHVMQVAELDPGMARPLGLMYKVIENHRPFDGEERVRAAYYLAVPFLFDARKPSPATRIR